MAVLTSSTTDGKNPESAVGGAPHRDVDVGGDLDGGPHCSVHLKLAAVWVGTFLRVAGLSFR